MHFSGLGINECTRSARHVQAARRGHRRPAHACIAVQRSRNPKPRPNNTLMTSTGVDRAIAQVPRWQMLHVCDKAYRVACRSTRRICATLADAYLVAASAARRSALGSACCERRKTNDSLRMAVERAVHARASQWHSGICIFSAA
jgi:hypothetical protein